MYGKFPEFHEKLTTNQGFACSHSISALRGCLYIRSHVFVQLKYIIFPLNDKVYESISNEA